MENSAENQAKNKRASIFSFGSDWVLADFIFFIVVVIIYGIIVTRYELVQGRASSVETLIAIVGDISSFIPVAVVLTLIFEGGGTLTVFLLWNLYMRKWVAQFERDKAEAVADGIADGEARGITKGITKGRAEGMVEGKTEGIAETYQLWSAWNERRLEAEANNRPFDEPPPAPPELPAA